MTGSIWTIGHGWERVVLSRGVYGRKELMNFRIALFPGILLCALAKSWGAPQAVERPSPPVPSSAKTPADFRPVIDKFCVSCHNQRLETGGLALDKLDMGNIEADGEVWEKVIRKLQVGLMPPPGLPRPDRTNTDALVAFLETNLDKAALAHPNPGRALLHRVNRAEYANAIRDLLALDIDVTSLLPPDDSG